MKKSGKRITDIELQKVMRYLSRQQSGTLNEDELKEIQKQALEDLVKKEALLQESDRLGIEVSDHEIAFELYQIEAFKGPDGKFSEELYEQILKKEGYSQGKFENQQKQPSGIINLGFWTCR